MLDTGDALIGGGILGDKTRGEAIVMGMNLMGYDAMALGPKELSLGAETLRTRMAQAKFPMLSANVREAGATQLFAQSHVILDVMGRRLAVIGLTEAPNPAVPGFEVLDPQASLLTALDQVRDRVDTTILLTNLGYRSALALVTAVPGIDLAIAAHPDQLPSQAVAAPNTGTLLVAAEQPLAKHTGRRVGRLVVNLGADGSLSRPQWQSVPMAPSLVDDPQMKALLDGYR